MRVREGRLRVVVIRLLTLADYRGRTGMAFTTATGLPHFERQGLLINVNQPYRLHDSRQSKESHFAQVTKPQIIQGKVVQIKFDQFPSNTSPNILGILLPPPPCQPRIQRG